MFDYKQRPWSREISAEEYARAVGNDAGHSLEECKKKHAHPGPFPGVPCLPPPFPVECLCIIGCSVNGRCPLHGDAAYNRISPQYCKTHDVVHKCALMLREAR